MKRLFTLLLVWMCIPLASMAQFGMNISGSHVIVHADTYLIKDGDLKISNTNGLLIKPNGFVTTYGDLSLNNAATTPATESNLIVATGPAGTGSYIVDGTVSHTGKGRATVKSYITGNAGTYFMHCVSASVQDTTAGYTNSVRLQQFDMTYLDTYAWFWDGSVADISNGQAWVNIWPYDYEVPLGWGLALTNDVAGTGTILMTGYPKSGDITFNTNYVVGNTIELIGNPYSSAIDFSAFYSDNATEIFNKFNIYDNGGGNYYQYVPGVNSPDIQVGQGFFVETRSTTSSVTFSNSHRAHSNVAFREVISNLLHVSVEGGNHGFKDNFYVRFAPEGTSYYDEEIEALKWKSISENATMIYTIGEDDSSLAVNVLPLVDLNSTMTTIPVHFECGENAAYTFTFSGIDSFDWGTEIWLEDKQSDVRWVYISSDEFQYNFSATPNDAVDRFFIHFFGPTYVPEDDPVLENNDFKIYAYENHAYVLNNSDETIKNITIHNIMGQTIYQGILPQQTLNKVFVSGQTGYYVVTVETDKKIYTEKVLILK